MKKTIEQYKAQFSDMCFDLIMNLQDYSDKEKLKKHNIAQKKLYQISKTISSDQTVAVTFFSDLMKSDSQIIQMQAAGYALSNMICVDKAIAVLKAFENGNDKNLAFHASRSLFVWEHQKKHETQGLVQSVDDSPIDD